MGQKRLTPVEIAGNWTSLVGALEGALRSLGEPRDTAELMGITGHAFRISLTVEEGVVAAGSVAVAVDFERALPLYQNAGRKLELIHAEAGSADFAKRREDALKRIRKNIDRGRPALAYDLHIPEFGAIYGYDDRAHTLVVASMMSGQYGAVLSESRWPVPERPQPLLVLLLGDRQKVDPRRAWRDALRFAVTYAEQGDPGDRSAADHGLAAYRRWQEAFSQAEPVDPPGHARAIQTVQTARRDAARFLRGIAPSLPAPARAPLTEAATAYDAVALAFSRMATFFPYPNGGDPSGPGARLVASSALREAEAQERTAVEALRAVVERI